MSSKFTERPGETTDQEAALHQQALEVAARREQYHRRMRIATIGAGVVVALAILGFVFVTLVLPQLAPAAPGTSLNPTQQAVLSLPPMSNDMGFWDRIASKPNPTQEAVLSLPPMSNDMGVSGSDSGKVESYPASGAVVASDVERYGLLGSDSVPVTVDGDQTGLI